MRKIIFLLSVVSTLFSCSSDDNEGGNDSSQFIKEIVGKWENYQKIEENQTFDVDECNRDTFTFFDDLTGSYSLNTGTMINGSCVGGSGGYGFNYEGQTNNSVRIFFSIQDLYILYKENGQFYLNPIDEDTGETNTSIKLLLRKVE